MKKYSRKDFLAKGAMAAVAGGSLLSACTNGEANQAKSDIQTQSSGKTYRWKMVTTWLPGFPVVGEGAVLFAEWVKKMSDGRLDIRVYGDKELVPAFEAFDAVSSGAADIGSGAAYYWAGKVPAAQFFATVPFGMNAQQMNTWLYRGGGMELWEEVYKPFNVLAMPGGNTGVQMGGWFNKEIRSMSDFRGLKMRIPGLGGKVLEKAGGSPTSGPGSEIYTNLETGVIDATEWIGPYHDYKKGFADIAKFYYTPGWHEPGTTLEIFINRSKFEELPADLQEIVRAAAARLNEWTLAEFEYQNGIFLKKLMDEKEVNIREFPPDVLTQMRALTREVIGELTSNDPLAKKVWEAYDSFHKRMLNWAKYSEKAYYERIQP